MKKGLLLLLSICLSVLGAHPLASQDLKQTKRPLRAVPAPDLPRYGSAQAFIRDHPGGGLRAHGTQAGTARLLPMGAAARVSLGQKGMKPFSFFLQDVQLLRAPDGTVRWMQGRLGQAEAAVGKNASEAQRADAALAVLQALARALKLDDPARELRLMHAAVDDLGYTHVRFAQTFGGLPVWGRDLYVHFDAQGVAYAVNGAYVPTPRGLDLAPQRAPEDALETVVADLKARGRWAPLSDEDAAWLGLDAPQTRLVIYPVPDGPVRLAFEVALHPNLVEWFSYLVDARTGEILGRIARHCTLRPDPDLGARAHLAGLRRTAPSRSGAFLDATATDLNGVQQSLRVFLEDDGTHFLLSDLRNIGAFTLPDIPRVGGAVTLDANNQDDFTANLTHVTSGDNTWNDPASVSAHVNMAVAYDYYRDTHGRQAINDRDESMISIVHITEEGQPMENAFWNGRIMGYGDGGTVFKPLAGGLDVAVHETTHGVIEHSANLVYQFQPGALNESMADVFGAMVDRGDFLMGEDIIQPGFGSALRDLADPASPGLNPSFRQPAHMNEFVNLGLEDDNGGVHVNSGIPNRAAFLVIDALGHDRAEQIYYRALTRYLTRSSQFGDARMALERAAADLHGAGSAEVLAVRTAFDAVGITDETSGPGDSEGNEVDPAEGTNLIAFLLEDGRVGLADLDALEFSVFDPNDALASTFTQLSTPADGSALYFINSDLKLARIDLATNDVFVFDDLFVAQEGDLWNVAVSPDDNFAVLASAYDNDPFVYITNGVDIAPIPLKAQTSQEGVLDESIVFPDVLSWSPNPALPRVTFDALREVTVGSDQVQFWSIFELDFATGRIFNLLGAQPAGVSVGNITYSNTDPDVVAFNVLDDQTGALSVVVADLASGAFIEVDPGADIDDPERPTFSPDDAQLAFTSVANNQIRLFAFDTGALTSLTFPEAVFHPRWFARAVGTDVEEAEVPERVALHAAYPNPFNPATTVAFSLPQTERVVLRVYNVLGQQVALLLDAVRPPGEHRLAWDASGLPSGTYLLRLHAGDTLQTRKVVLAK